MTTLRIATWNLMDPPATGLRRKKLLSMMKKIDTEVWVLTETHPSFSPGDDYNCISRSAAALEPDCDSNKHWVAIWVKKPLMATSETTSDTCRTACAKISLPNDQAVYIYGTVLPWLTDKRSLPLKGKEAFIAELKKQGSDWAKLRDDHPNSLICIAGDFNQDLLNDGGHFYGSKTGRNNLRQTLSESGLTCLTEKDNDPVHKFRPHLASVDHICISSQFTDYAVKLTEKSIWPSIEEHGKKLSDHFGVVVVINLPEKSGVTSL
jgi:hypothetical protein